MNKKKETAKSKLSTPQTPQLKNSICPYWHPTSRACLSVKDGLFIPVYQHVETYCLSSRHSSCSHYHLTTETQAETGKNQASPSNRRRSIRVPNFHNFRFSEITNNDQIPGLQEDDAWTVDLSDCGIRFASRQLLTPDTAIYFSLVSDDTATTIEGTGKVIWSEPLANTPLFHAGIVFIDQKSSSLFAANNKCDCI
jgi:hypothetical protein